MSDPSGTVIGRDPWSGATETFHWDEENERAIIRHSCDVAPLLDANKEAANHGTTLRPREDDLELRLVARIPTTVALKWYVEKGISAWKRADWPRVKRLLNDSEYRYLRVNSMVL